MSWKVALVAVALGCAACAGEGVSTGQAAPAAATSDAACRLLEREEVEQLVGHPVHEGRPSSAASGRVDSVCLWGDADPAAPGHIVTVTLQPADAVDSATGAGEGAAVYDLEQLGEGATAVQRAPGAVVVTFTAGDTRVEMSYDVVPGSYATDGAVDRLARLAGVVAGRIEATSTGER